MNMQRCSIGVWKPFRTHAAAFNRPYQGAYDAAR